jgi:hypothetical protein
MPSRWSECQTVRQLSKIEKNWIEFEWNGLSTFYQMLPGRCWSLWNPRCTTATSIMPDPAVLRGHTGRDRPSGTVLGKNRTEIPR